MSRKQPWVKKRQTLGKIYDRNLFITTSAVKAVFPFEGKGRRPSKYGKTNNKKLSASNKNQ